MKTSSCRARAARIPSLAAVVIGLLAAVGTASVSRAQTLPPRLAAPRIGYVYPAGGQVGTTFTVTVGGQFLGDVSGAEFFGGGVLARVTNTQRPFTQKELEALKAEGDALREKGRAARKGEMDASGAKIAWTPADEKRAGELRATAGYRMNRQTAPAICEAVTFEVTIAPDAKPGVHEIRLRGPNGHSHPLVFQVGALAEFAEPAAHPNTAAPDLASPGNDGPRRVPPAPRNPERTLTLPGVANGQVLPGEVDRWRFHAQRGQRLVVAVSARALVPYLADAVPGWFQATLTLRDAAGHELAYDDDFRFSPDPVLFHEVRADGDYVLEIKDAIYRGRQDFVYRVVVGELPFVTGVFPLGGAVGRRTEVRLAGWNLPAPRTVVDASGESGVRQAFAVAANGSESNRVEWALGGDPEVIDPAGNDRAETAPTMPAPFVVNGKIERAGDADWIAIEARPGATLRAVVEARRLNSPLDSLLIVRDAEGKELARNDDYEDRGEGLETHHADSETSFTVPASGRAFVRVSDAQGQGGAEFAYRLSVHEPRPDFALRVVPASLNLRPGTHVVATAYVLRREGFTGAVELRLREGSGPLALHGAVIPAGEDAVRFTVTTNSAPREEPYHPQFVGFAELNGRKVARAAVPCEDQMQAFAYRHLVPTQSIDAVVVGRAVGPRRAMSVEPDGPLTFGAAAAGPAHVAVEVPLADWFAEVRAELVDPPAGVTLAGQEWHGTRLELTFACDGTKAKPGAAGNLIVQLSGRRPGADADKAKKTDRTRFPLTVLPALSFRVAAAPAP